MVATIFSLAFSASEEDAGDETAALIIMAVVSATIAGGAARYFQRSIRADLPDSVSDRLSL